MFRRFLLLSTLLCISAAPAFGQAGTTPPDTALARVARPMPRFGLPADPVPGALPSSAASGRPMADAPLVHLSDGVAVADAAAGGGSFTRGLLYTIGGVVVGSWIGYMASQVVQGDWDKSESHASHRLGFTIGGAAVGGIGGLLFGHATAPRGPRVLAANHPSSDSTASSRYIIGLAEIREDPSIKNVGELIRTVRPSWIGALGPSEHVNSNTRATVVTTASGVRQIEVYADGKLVGGIDMLDRILLDSVIRIQFLTPSEATRRLGAGNQDGAILIETGAGR